MKSIILFALFINSLANAVSILNVRLKSTDVLGFLTSQGTVSVNLDPSSFEIQTIETFFKVKALGIRVKSVGPIFTPLKLQSNLVLLHSDHLKDISSIIPNKGLITIFIKAPSASNNVLFYPFEVNYLKAFGERAPSVCHTPDKIPLTLTQDKDKFFLYYQEEFDNPIHTLVQNLSFTDDEKILHRLELIGTKRTITINYSKCRRQTLK